MILLLWLNQIWTKVLQDLLLLLSWPPVCEMCPNYEVMMFQPQTGTPPDLGSVDNCYIAILRIPTSLFPPATRCLTGGDTRSWTIPLSLVDWRLPIQDHYPNRASPFSVSAYRDLSLPASDSASLLPSQPSLCLPDSQRHSLANSEISSDVTLRCLQYLFVGSSSSRNAYDHFGLSTLCLTIFQLFKCPLVSDWHFYIDINR